MTVSTVVDDCNVLTCIILHAYTEQIYNFTTNTSTLTIYTTTNTMELNELLFGMYYK